MLISRIKGRTDDMLIIRGVNVFPSQIEALLLDIEEVEPQKRLGSGGLHGRDQFPTVTSEVRGGETKIEMGPPAVIARELIVGTNGV